MKLPSMSRPTSLEILQCSAGLRVNLSQSLSANPRVGTKIKQGLYMTSTICDVVVVVVVDFILSRLFIPSFFS